jgi:hypothetical protein
MDEAKAGWRRVSAFGFLRRPECDQRGMICWEAPDGQCIFFPPETIALAARADTGRMWVFAMPMGPEDV